MATPPESPVEEHAYELEPSRTPKPIPVALEELCRQTKFSKQEIRVMYRGFKTVRYRILLINSFQLTEIIFKYGGYIPIKNQRNIVAVPIVT